MEASLRSDDSGPARDQQARALFEGIDDAVFVHDLEGNIIDANPAACRRLGYTRAELLRLHTWDIDAPEFAAGFAERLLRQKQTGTLSCEGRHITKDGRIIPVDINTSMIRINGEPAVLSVIRDISTRQATERRLAAHYSLTRILAESATVADATPQILRTIGEGLGWEISALWLVDPLARVVRCQEVWTAPSLHVPRFEAVSRQSSFPPGRGLPGRVWVSGKAAWIPNVARDDNCPRGLIAASEGLHGAFAFPIRSHTETIGVIESFTRTSDKPDDDWLSMLAALGSQIGQFIERKRFEEALRESEALYHSLVECLPQHIFRKDRAGRFTFANQRFCQLIGKPLEQVLGKTDFDFWPHELADKYRSDDQRVMDTGQVLELIEANQAPSGEVRYVQVVKTPVFDSRGAISGIQGIFWDVTARKRAEDALAESERRYRQLTESSLDAIIVADQQGCITLFNPAAEKTFGYQAAEVLGQPLTRLMPPAYADVHQQGLERFVRTREALFIGRTVELRGRKKDGTEFPLELSLAALEVGTELQFLGALRDLTERNRMRAVLVQSEKLASIGLLSAGVAHEINNPLAYVANNLAVLERDTKGLVALLALYESVQDRLDQAVPEVGHRIRALGEEIDLPYIRDNLERVLTRTRDGVQRVTRIVHSLRGLARTAPPQMEEANLPDLVDMAMEMVRGRLQRRGVQLELDYEANLPKVRCVATQIGQVLLNLLINAVQAIEATDRTEDARIRITSRLRPGEVAIEVADNGCGIDPRDLPRLFDPFFTTKPVGEGTGLGLSITHGIVTGHSGRIEVESEPGQGSRFRVILPLEPHRGGA